MKDPRRVLGVADDASPAEIRQRYLELVHENPPEKEDGRFAEIRAAFELLSNPVKRIEALLLGNEEARNIDSIVTEMGQRLRSRRLPLKTLAALAESDG